VEVAEIIGAHLGWVILLGFLVGIPVAVLAGPVWGSFISRRIVSLPPETDITAETSQTPSDTGYGSEKDYPAFRWIVLIIGCPLVLILLNTITAALIKREVLVSSIVSDIIIFVGHPFSALIIATLLAMYFLGIRRGIDRKTLQQISNQSLGPAGIIILVTGAGGVLKQVLVDSGMADDLARAVAASSINPLVLAWVIAAVVRVTQGSATVAMITSAGIVGPVLPVFGLTDPQMGLMVIAIASGATILSHVNDSGFWLVGKYLGINEKQTLQSWTVMETIIAVSGLCFTWVLYQFL